MSSNNSIEITAFLASILIFSFFGVEAVITLAGNSTMLIDQFEQDSQSSLIGFIVGTILVIAVCLWRIIWLLWSDRRRHNSSS